MNRLTRFFVCLALVAGCSNDSARSLLPIDLVAAADVGTISSVDVAVSQNGNQLTSKHLAWDAPAGQALQVGIYLSHDVSGTVNVTASALDAGGNVIGMSETATATVNPGKASDVVTLHVVRATGSGDGGVPPADGGGLDHDGGPGTDMIGGGNGDVPPGTDVVPPDGGTPPAPDAAVGLTWQTPENLEPNDIVNRSYAPVTGVDAQGNVIAAWVEDTEVKSRRWDAASKTWGDTKTVDSRGSVAGPALKVAPNGHAVLMWFQQLSDTSDPLNGIWASQSKDGGLNWSPAKQIHAAPVYGDISLAISRAGHARAAWIESINNMASVWSAHYDDASGLWSDVALVKQGEDTDDRVPKVAMDAQGGGLIVWRQADAMMQQSAWGSSFAPNQALKGPQVLDTVTANSIYDPVVAVMPDGSKGMAVWSQSGSGGYDVYFSDWTAAAGWSAPMKGIPNADFGWPILLMDQSGTATVVYYQNLNIGTINVVAARRPAGQPWGMVMPLETTDQVKDPNNDSLPLPAAAVDPNGVVHVTWHRKVGASDANTYSIVVRSWAMGTWQPEKTLFMKDKMHANFPDVAVGDDGHAAIVFTYWDPSSAGDQMTYSVFASLFR